MTDNTQKPVIVREDGTILLETYAAEFEQARSFLVRFADLIKSPEYIYTFKVTPVSLWNACSAGMRSNEILKQLSSFSKERIPPVFAEMVRVHMDRWGKLVLTRENDELVLTVDIPKVRQWMNNQREIRKFQIRDPRKNRFFIKEEARGSIKRAMARAGFPVVDQAGFDEGDTLDISLRKIDRLGRPFGLRDYQQEALESFFADSAVKGGQGVVVLPCGAGKTVIGIGAMAYLKSHTLIVATSATAINQWIRELTDKTTIDPSLIGEYTGQRKTIKPVTVTNYQILTHRKSTLDDFTHMHLFEAKNWGLIIYDEVHLLPAPVFRLTTGIQAKRRLGLTATLIREDGLEKDIFSLIGPCKHYMPWKTLEEKKWIATVHCYELQNPLPEELHEEYFSGDRKQKFRVASENPDKLNIIRRLLEIHKDDHVLIIGQYLNQLKDFAKALGAPVLTGKTPQAERIIIYNRFRAGKINVLAVSKVANFAVDLPDANICIQISGTYGSRQEEAQRLGRILRPKTKDSYFYSLVTEDSLEHEFAMKRQLFLTEQGYDYTVLSWRNIKTDPV